MALYGGVSHVAVSISLTVHAHRSQHIAHYRILSDSMDYGDTVVDYCSHSYCIFAFAVAMEKYIHDLSLSRSVSSGPWQELILNFFNQRHEKSIKTF